MKKIAAELFLPPILTILCWLLSQLRARFQHDRPKAMTWPQFWLLLISAYIMTAVCLWGANLFAPHDHGDGSFELLQ